MKKTLTYSIIAVTLLVVIIAGATYAYFSFVISSSNNVNTSTKKFGIVYSGGTHINNLELNVSSDKSGGYSTTVSIRTEDSTAVQPKATIYINIHEISENLRISGFKWEVYRNNESNAFSQGNFAGYNDTTNNIVNIVEDYQLSSTNTTFTVYFWIDGNDSTSDVIGGEFEGYIEAKTEEFKAEVSAS